MYVQPLCHQFPSDKKYTLDTKDFILWLDRFLLECRSMSSLYVLELTLKNVKKIWPEWFFKIYFKKARIIEQDSFFLERHIWQLKTEGSCFLKHGIHYLVFRFTLGWKKKWNVLRPVDFSDWELVSAMPLDWLSSTVHWEQFWTHLAEY